MGKGKIAIIFLCVATAAACATGRLETDDTTGDSSTTPDGTTPPQDGGGGKDVGVPTADGSCASPTTKCASDAGAICVNAQTDPDHCGQCTNVCTAGDAGSLAQGSNNPDAGVVYDSGTGWTLGSPDCEAGACNVTCAAGFTACNGICFDTQNFHDHCGTCSTACTAQEWCNHGNCCALGQEYCGNACIDVLGDANNCGSCGNVCPSQTPTCVSGKCSAVTAVTFSQSFTVNQIATTECTAWTTFRTALSGTYTSIKMTGTNDSTGRTCTGTGANTLCQALHSGTATSVLCNGHTWYIDDCSGLELTADDSACTCQTPGYAVRPCLYENGDWGGVNTATCGGPTQTMTVTCQ